MTRKLKTKKSNIINLYDIPTGKQSFTATVKKIIKKEESDYFGNTINVPYVCFKDIKILIDKTWFRVDCSSITIKSKIGKRLENLNLESEDLIVFDAKVEEDMIEFFYVDGIDNIKNEIDNEPLVYLPKDYDGLIIVEIYETEFTPYFRVSKENYTQHYDRITFNQNYKFLNYKRKPNGKKFGLYREIQAMYYLGKSIKNLSNIEKF